MDFALHSTIVLDNSKEQAIIDRHKNSCDPQEYDHLFHRIPYHRSTTVENRRKKLASLFAGSKKRTRSSGKKKCKNCRSPKCQLELKNNQ